MANFETKRRCRRLVNDSAFADRKLTGHDWRGHLVGAVEQGGGHGLFLTLGLIRTIVRPTCIRSSRDSSQFPYFSPDRTEWAEPMLLFGKSVRIGAVWSVDRFLEPNGKILVEVRLLRPLLAHDVACDVIGLLVRQQRGVETGAKRHVVKSVSCCGQKPTHSGAVVVVISSPERRKLIAKPVLRALSRAVCAVTCRANLRIDFRAARGISGAIGLLDLQRAGATELRAVGNAGGKPAHIGGKSFHLL